METKKMKPIILINFKNYKEAIGEKALQLAEEISKVKKKKYTIIIAPSLLTLREIISKARIPVVAQHLDPIINGAYTGSISVMEAKKIGVKGTILNHSEKKVPLKRLKETVDLCRKNKLKTIVLDGRKIENIVEEVTTNPRPEFLTKIMKIKASRSSSVNTLSSFC